ncbi:Agamous-like MADS-box protein AGL103 [Camellia lanceoleosa]|uniref:Agamous-like MADS-box protein AGL103 n=1 Tax=Camellia lanceoleosa TaxID=1840588 RepID=A0ACC0FDH2_9ERIC|nr:Agamous-like MADS-box protein AGL103 [Camellia lanceoleosa]
MEDDEKGKKTMKRIENKKALRVTHKKRKDCVIKKTMELSILCGINVFTLCFGPNGEVDTWPQNPNEVKALIRMYKESAKKSPKVLGGNEDGYGWLDGLSAESVMSFLGKLDSKLEVLKARIEFLKMVNEQKNRVVVMGKETEETCWFDDTNAIDNLQKNRGVIVMGKQTEEASWFDDTTLLPQPLQQTTQLDFETDNFPMLIESCYQPQPQPQPQQQAIQLNFEMTNASMLMEPCYQPQQQQQDTQLNFVMDNLSMLLDLCHQYQSGIF